VADTRAQLRVRRGVADRGRATRQILTQFQRVEIKRTPTVAPSGSEFKLSFAEPPAEVPSTNTRRDEQAIPFPFCFTPCRLSTSHPPSKQRNSRPLAGAFAALENNRPTEFCARWAIRC
jgi:hypothetical protein